MARSPRPSHTKPTLAFSARLSLFSCAASITLGLASCASSPSATNTPPPSARPPRSTLPSPARIVPPALTDTKPRDYPGIHNAVAYHENFISGSVPEGDAGFDTLAAMGIKTVISVDGAEPEVAKATTRGIRYIHLPIGYNGFDEQRKLELVRATRDALAQGPVYIHCHHGKHRSAGAAAAILASLGWATPQYGVDRMKVSGTAPNYTGLFACAANSSVLSPAVIDSVPADFPSISKPSDFVKGMLEINEIFDHLKLIEKAIWSVPADHPDLVPVSEAGRLADLYRVLGETAHAKAKPAEFASLMKESNARAQALEDLLASGKADPAKLSAQFKLVGASCKDCHATYRDPAAEPVSDPKPRQSNATISAEPR